MGGLGASARSEPVRRIPSSEPVRRIPSSEPIRRIPSSEPVRRIPSSEPVRRIPSSEPVRDWRGEEQDCQNSRISVTNLAYHVGDGFFFYPPRQDNANLDYCGQNGHRLVPSLRWEHLRDGMEDYEYLWLLAGGDPQAGVDNAADAYVAQLVASCTRFSHVPTDLAATRAAIAQALVGPTDTPSAQKTAWPPAVAPGAALTYTLAYTQSDVAGTLLVTDVVPDLTPVLTATGPGTVQIDGQHVRWRVTVDAGASARLHFRAQAGPTPGGATQPGRLFQHARADAHSAGPGLRGAGLPAARAERMSVI